MLPLATTIAPTTPAEVAEAVRAVDGEVLAVYPLGGETSLGYGLIPKQQGWGISLAKLDRIIDYPARDMTITVEAGLPVARLQAELATERQELPLDFAHFDRATVGGVIATNPSGPRRFGHGTLRDYLIGVEAVDGAGRVFHGGGRVVKNVAGYDFCRLLIGSCGTLGIMTRLTFKVKPLAEAAAAVICSVRDLGHLRTLLEKLSATQTAPAVLDAVGGPAWRGIAELDFDASPTFARLVIGVEGTTDEVNWMVTTLCAELADTAQVRIAAKDEWPGLLRSLTEFAADGGAATLKMRLLPSRAVVGLEFLLNGERGESLSWHLHAGNGILFARYDQEPTPNWQSWLLHTAHPGAAKQGGALQLWRFPSGVDFTHQAAWGYPGEELPLLQAIRQQFDPRGRLNPGRFW